MPQQKIFTAEVLRKLAANGKATRERDRRTSEPDHVPVLKIFNPYGGATWLFTEIDEDGDRLFGLCDLGSGFPELGYASRRELEDIRIVRGGYRLPLERDAWFKADKTLSEYAAEARTKGRLVA